MAENVNEMTPEQMEELFKQAKNTYFFSNTEEKIREAQEMFRALGDYKNSAEFLAKCEHYFYFSVGNTVKFGNFEGRDLEWEVLDGTANLRLLFATRPVTHMAYNKIHENTLWRDADLRTWLNFQFPNKAFNLSERMNLFATNRQNPENHEWFTQNGPDTRDKIFVFSFDEITQYKPEEADRAIGEWYWLRDSGHSLLTAEAVYNDGMIYSIGLRISDPEVAVRPAMWIKVPK